MAIIYTRISQDKTGEGAGVERQEKECRGLAKRLNLDISKVYRENDTSASKGPRPVFEQMILDLKAEPQEVIVWAQDRLLRQTKDLEVVIDLGVDVHTVVAGSLNLSNAATRAMARTLAAFSQFEVEQKADRQKARNRQNIEKGLPVPGKRRFGFLPGNLKLREDEAAVMRGIYEDFLDGKTIYSIARDLTDRGVPYRDRAYTWTPARLREMMRNPGYSGCIVVKGEGIPSPHVERLIDQESWERIQAKLDDPTRRTSPGPSRKHLMSGLMTCGTCGGAMRHMAEGYYCQNPRAGHPMISDVKLYPIIREQIALAIMFAPPAAFTTPEMDERPLVAELRRIKGEVDQCAADRAEGLMDADTARKTLILLRERREPLEQRLRQIRANASGLSVLAKLAGRVAPQTKKVRLGDGNDPMKVRTVILKAFDRLGLDQQREVVAALMDIKIYPGRNNAERVKIHHKIAVSLNPEEER